MNHIIITGSSKGLGHSLATVAARSNTTLHLIARSNQQNLMEQLSLKGAHVFTYQFDLCRTDGIEVLTDQVFGNIPLNEAKRIFLINNAGLLEPVGPIGKYDTQAYRTNLEVNFVAPVLLCQEFIKRTVDSNAQLRILNVSSGASLKPYYGWSHYCSTKAGLDMMTSCIALEHGERIGCAAYNPGRTDTGMQNTIRETTADDFKHVQSFIDAYEDGILNDPVEVATDMLAVLFAETFPVGETVRFNR